VNHVIAVRLLRLVGLCLLLVGLYHLGAIAFMTALGRSQLLFTYIVFGLVLSVVGFRLLRGDLSTLFHPSRYDIWIGCISGFVMAYYLSWIFLGRSLWTDVTRHSPFSYWHTGHLIGVGFLITFAVASIIWVGHSFVLLLPSLRARLCPALLSHLAALLLLLPSLRIGSQTGFLFRTFFGDLQRTSNQTLERTADRLENYEGEIRK
jgi:hypothetical protein